MAQTDVCVLCGGVFTRQRNPYQTYCSSAVCQRKRKNLWRTTKVKNDSDYRINQKLANQQWQSKNRDYWRNYRASHPDYVHKNREAQRVRDKSYKNNASHHVTDNGVLIGNASHLAKSDALSQKTIVNAGAYWLFPMDSNLAKSDALLVEIAVIARGEDKVANLAKISLYSHGG